MRPKLSEAIRGYPGNVIFLGAADHGSPGAKALRYHLCNPVVLRLSAPFRGSKNSFPTAKQECTPALSLYEREREKFARDRASRH